MKNSDRTELGSDFDFNKRFPDKRASHIALYSLRPTIRDASYLRLGHVASHSRIPPLRAGVSVSFSGDNNEMVQDRLAVTYSVFNMRHLPSQSDTSYSIPYKTMDYRKDIHDLSIEEIGSRTLYLESSEPLESLNMRGPKGSFDIRERFLVGQQELKKRINENKQDDSFWNDDSKDQTCNASEKAKSAAVLTPEVQQSLGPHSGMTNKTCLNFNIQTDKHDYIPSHTKQQRRELFPITCHPLQIVTRTKLSDTFETEVTDTFETTLRWLKTRATVPTFNQVHVSRHTLRPRFIDGKPSALRHYNEDIELRNLEEILKNTQNYGGIVIPSTQVLQERTLTKEYASSRAIPLTVLLSDSFDATALNRQQPMLSAPVLRRMKTI